MTVGFTGMTANITLSPPWGLVTAAGIIVHAHGTQTGQDTTAYSVSFASLVPGSGSVTRPIAQSLFRPAARISSPFPRTCSSARAVTGEGSIR